MKRIAAIAACAVLLTLGSAQNSIAEAGDAKPLGPACAIPGSSYGHFNGSILCGTSEMIIPDSGDPEGAGPQDIIIGSDYYVYRDAGLGWFRWDNGRASSWDGYRPEELGINSIHLGISVLGTDGESWCRTYNSLGAWNGWHHCA